MRNTIQLLITLLILAPSISFAQITTSSISGFVKSKAGVALNGANIKAIHEPTGTVYVAKSTKSGAYEIVNATPGGPYTVRATYPDFEEAIEKDIYLTLGENQKVDIIIFDKYVTTLADVTVTSKRTATKTGTETNLSNERIQNAVTVGRNLNDFVRLNPQTKITNDGGISLAGQNNRFNNFMIDGAVNNDVFGLAGSGTNGGQAGVPPISIDAIDQITVQLNPYDAAIGGFTGGGINAITKKGSNNLTGSVYYYMRNEKLTGKTPGFLPQILNQKRIRQTPFDNKTFGFTLGGPIIKNKVFFFINAERQDDERPQNSSAPDIAANGYNIKDSIAKLRNFLKTNYGYETGDYINNPDLITRTNVNARFDINVNAKNKVTLSYGINKAERFNPARSSDATINFFNSAQFFPTTTNRGSFEWLGRFSNKANNKLRISLTDVVDDRGVTGSPFPNVTIQNFANTTLGLTAGPTMNFGSELFSTANKLEQRIINIFENFRYNIDKHTISVGADIDLNKTLNLFIGRNYGFYQYSSLFDFMNGRAPTRYRRAYSLVDPGKSGDDSKNSAANFESLKMGFFLNDEIKVSRNFTITAGLRADKLSFLTEQKYVDPFLKDSALPLIKAAGYDLRGAEVGKLFNPSWQFSPRLGFKYNADAENVIIRGGVGVFTGRTPLVWPSGFYQNNGNSIGAIDRSSSAGVTFTPPGGTAGPLPFRPDVNNQYTLTDFGVDPTLAKSQGDINLLAKDLKLPSGLKWSLGIDKKFNNGWSVTTDLSFTKNLQEIEWTNLNLLNNFFNITSGPDKRRVYANASNLPTGGAVNGTNSFVNVRPNIPASSPQAAARFPYTSVILISNEDGKKGFSYNFTVDVEKNTRTGWFLKAFYSYGNSVVNNEGTSSINTSNWSFIETVNGRNFISRSTSDFDLGHRIVGNITKKFNYAKKHAATTLTFLYNGQSGSPYSITYNGAMVGDGVGGNDLIYVPKDRAEMDLMVFVTNNASVYPPASLNGGADNIRAQKDAFEAYIQRDPYLSKRRGMYAERNGARLPFVNQVDFKIQQEFSVKIGGKRHSFTASWDVFNFTNLLNPNWGRQMFLANDVASPVQFAGYATGGVPTYRFNIPTGFKGNVYSISDGVTPFNNSRWTSQLGIRYNFR